MSALGTDLSAELETQGLDRDLLERVEPVRRQLLGAGASMLGHWLPTDEDVPLRMR